MSKNLKDLIDQAEDEQNTHSHFVSKIESLQMKVTKLETKLELQKESSKPKKSKKGKRESEEINLLKEQISSQKQEFAQMQKEYEVHLQSHNYLIKDFERLEKLNKSLEVEISNIDNKKNLLLETIKKNERDSKKQLNDLERKNKYKVDNLVKENKLTVDKLVNTLQNLKKQLDDLEKENILIVENLEKENKLTIDNLEKENKSSIDNLEKAIYDLESMNSESQKANQKLAAKLNTVEADRFRLTKFEAKASNLEKEIQVLQKENEELKQKDAILLAKTINVMETRKKEPTIIVENLVSEEPLLEEKEGVKIEEPVEISLENEMVKEETVTRKKVCPNCGNTNKDFIREFDDKTKIIYTHPKIYAKMYRCGQCKTEWR